jgi:hypothetical protein
MSYDLAVWEGEHPAGHAEAAKVFMQLHSDALRLGWATPPFPRYVESLRDRWPEQGADGGHDSPWSDYPLLANACGPFFYFGLAYSIGPQELEQAVGYAAELAVERGLMCYDVQYRRLLSVPVEF